MHKTKLFFLNSHNRIHFKQRTSFSTAISAALVTQFDTTYGNYPLRSGLTPFYCLHVSHIPVNIPNPAPCANVGTAVTWAS